MEQTLEGIAYGGDALVHSIGKGLKGNEFIVLVDDEAGEKVALTVDQSERFGCREQTVPELKRIPNATFEESGPDFRLFARKMANGYEGVRIEEPDPQQTIVMIPDFDDVAGRRCPFYSCNLVAKDPLVPREQTLVFMFFENDLLFHTKMVDRNGARCKNPKLIELLSARRSENECCYEMKQRVEHRFFTSVNLNGRSV